jgi:tRNA(Ile)-lysidine synthase
MNKSGLLPIESTVLTKLDTYFSALDSPLFVIGVSGGADSMCLLHIFWKLGIDLSVVHINYQKRGEASDLDAELAKKASKNFGYNCDIITASSREAAGQNFQQWARKVRYKAFENKAAEIGAGGIITAHHQDDQIETILQKIFRGAGLANWSAMHSWNGRLFRPLLEVSRSEILTYCRKQSVEFRVDSSNLKSEFARNFLRNEWLTNLEQHFPGWRKNVLRISDQADVFKITLQHILDDIMDDKSRLKRSRFLRLEKQLQKSLLVYYLHRMDASAKISRKTLKEIDKLANLQTGKSIQLNENIELMRDRNFLKLVVNTVEPRPFIILRKKDLEGRGILYDGWQFKMHSFDQPDFAQFLYLDRDKMAWPLHLRRWRKGDRFQPFGMNGHQSLADHLTNRKVSAAKKSGALVLETTDKTICAVLFSADDERLSPGTISGKVRCDESTVQCLMITSKSKL